MENQSPTSAQPRRKKRVLVAIGILGLLVVAAGGWAFLKFSGHNMTGLEGTWRDAKDSRQIYEFQPDGHVDRWFGGHKSWWNRTGWSATWRRDGQLITIRTDRNWDFVGHLDGGAIRGNLLIRDENGATVNTPDAVWLRD